MFLATVRTYFGQEMEHLAIQGCAAYHESVGITIGRHVDWQEMPRGTV